MICSSCKDEMHLAEPSESGDLFSISAKWPHKPNWIVACVMGLESMVCDTCIKEVAADSEAFKAAVNALKLRVDKLAEPPNGFTYNLFAEKNGSVWGVRVATNKPYCESPNAQVSSKMIRAGLVAAQEQGFDATPEIKLLKRIGVLLRLLEMDAPELVQQHQRKLVRKALRVFDKRL